MTLAAGPQPGLGTLPPHSLDFVFSRFGGFDIVVLSDAGRVSPPRVGQQSLPASSLGRGVSKEHRSMSFQCNPTNPELRIGQTASSLGLSHSH